MYAGALFMVDEDVEKVFLFLTSGYNFVDVGFPGKFSVEVYTEKLCGCRRGNAPAMDE